MLQKLTRPYDHVVALLSGRTAESIALLFVRVALGAIFWFSGRTKIEEGSLLTVSENAIYQFSEEPFSNVPLLPSEFAAYLTTYAEHFLPLLLFVGLFTRLSALALLGMTLVIQLFVFPEAWWQVHIIWVALALVLITRGGGRFSLDALLSRRRT